jgi:hypothetical protein
LSNARKSGIYRGTDPINVKTKRGVFFPSLGGLSREEPLFAGIIPYYPVKTGLSRYSNKADCSWRSNVFPIDFFWIFYADGLNSLNFLHVASGMEAGRALHAAFNFLGKAVHVTRTLSMSPDSRYTFKKFVYIVGKRLLSFVCYSEEDLSQAYLMRPSICRSEIHVRLSLRISDHMVNSFAIKRTSSSSHKLRYLFNNLLYRDLQSPRKVSNISPLSY